MKLKITLLGFFLSMLIFKLEAQTFCFTPSTTSNTILNKSAQMKGANNSSYCLKVYFHVIRRSDGTGGQSITAVNTAFNFLNQDYSSHDIFFNWDNQIDYIDSNTYYNNPTTAIFNINSHQDGIDIYLFDDSSNAGGKANGVGESSEFWVSGSYWDPPYGSLVNSHVVSHEMGHVLFLWHTHHGTFDEGGNDNPCPELVNGSNSSTCGDYVTDTPADPHLDFDVNPTSCQWNSNGTDANGDSYNPDENLIMSYSHMDCLQYFSQKQGERMRNAITTLPYLQQVVTTCSPKLTSIDGFLCYPTNQTLTVSNLGNNTVNWTISSNVSIVSSTATTITIKALYSSSYGQGWVKANLSSGSILTETFGVNGSENEIPMSVTVSLVNNYLTITIHNGSGKTPYDLYFNNVYKLSTNSRTITFAYYQNSGRVEIRNENSCGTGINYAYYTGYFGGYNYYSIYPNPTSEMLTVERIDETFDDLNELGFDINQFDEKSKYELYDFNQKLVLKGKIKKISKIDVTSLKPGKYILKIITKDYSEAHHIIIN